MKPNYYAMNIDSEQLKERNKRKQIMKGKIKIGCIIAITVLVFVILGIAGGFENEMLTLREWALYTGLSTGIVWILFAIYRKL